MSTIDADTAPHLTYYAQRVVRTQADLVANYKYEMVQAANPAIFSVFDRRPAGSETVRTVTITEASMHCTCGFPLAYLLPCRHVLVVNNHIYNTQFRVSQVGKRWLRAHMPMVHNEPPHLPYQPPLDVSVPSFSSTVAAAAANMPARSARWGQLMGWCTTIVSIASEYGELYGFVARRIEALCKEVEALVSKPAAARDDRLAADVGVGASVESELHSAVSVAQMQMPPHRKRKRGNASEKRQQTAVELASRALRVSLTASQAM